MKLSDTQFSAINMEGALEWFIDFVSNIFSLRTLSVLHFLATIIVIILITVILYTLVRLYEIRREDKQKEKTSSPTIRQTVISGLPAAIDEDPEPYAKANQTWESIRSKLLSDNASDWRLAIIEADIYLDKLLDQKGFHADTIGDKLKSITPDQLASIQIAWEAHKVRNRIAHEGADFNLTMPESRRVLSYFEIVFRDLGAIE